MTQNEEMIRVLRSIEMKLTSPSNGGTLPYLQGIHEDIRRFREEVQSDFTSVHSRIDTAEESVGEIRIAMGGNSKGNGKIHRMTSNMGMKDYILYALMAKLGLLEISQLAGWL